MTHGDRRLTAFERAAIGPTKFDGRPVVALPPQCWPTTVWQDCCTEDRGNICSPEPIIGWQHEWPCHRRQPHQWCDRYGPGGFMGHTCTQLVAQPPDNLLTFPTIRGESDADGGVLLKTIVSMRLPQRSGSRLRRLASARGTSDAAVAEQLLIEAIDAAAHDLGAFAWSDKPDAERPADTVRKWVIDWASDPLPIAQAPLDGTFVRLFFRPGFGREEANGVEAQWQPHPEMPAGGAWFDREGHYVTPGPIGWAPIGGFQ